MSNNPLVNEGDYYYNQVEKIASEYLARTRNPSIGLPEAFVWGYLAATSQIGTLEFIFDRVKIVANAEKDGILDKTDKLNLFKAFTKNITFDVDEYINQKLEDPSKLADLIKRDSKEEAKLSEELIKKLNEEDTRELESIREKREKESNVPCKICLENLSDQPFTVVSECGDVFHVHCLQRYAKEKIESRSLPVTCPTYGCKAELMLPDLEEILDKKLLENYREYALKNYLDLHSEEVTWCPTADCPFVFVNEDKITDFTCPVCSQRYCFACRAPYHKGQTCKEYQISNNWGKDDQVFINLVKTKKFKQCPQCKYWIEKTEGCDNMHCRCGFTFCYRCGNSPCRCGHKFRPLQFRRIDVIASNSRPMNVVSNPYLKGIYKKK